MEKSLGRGSIRISNGVESLQIGILFLSETIRFFSLTKTDVKGTLYEILDNAKFSANGELLGKGSVSFSNWLVSSQASFSNVILSVHSLSETEESFSLKITHDAAFSTVPHGEFSNFQATIQFQTEEGISFSPDSCCQLEFETYTQNLTPDWSPEFGLIMKNPEDSFRLDGVNMIPVGNLGKYGLKEITREVFDPQENLILNYTFADASGTHIYDNSFNGLPNTLEAKPTLLPKTFLQRVLHFLRLKRYDPEENNRKITVDYTDEAIVLNGEYFLQPASGMIADGIRQLKISQELSFEIWIDPSNHATVGRGQIFEITGKNNRNWFTVCCEKNEEGNSFIAVDIWQSLFQFRWRRAVKTPEGYLPSGPFLVTLTFNKRGFIRIYINGKKQAEQPLRNRITDWDDNFLLVVGRNKRNRDTNHWSGKIHHLSFYNRAFSEEEIYRRHNASGKLRGGFIMENVPPPLKDFVFDSTLHYEKASKSLSIHHQDRIEVRPNLLFDAVKMEMHQEDEHHSWIFASEFDMNMWGYKFPLTGYLTDHSLINKTEEQVETVSSPPPVHAEVITQETADEDYRLLVIKNEDAETIFPLEVGELGTFEFKNIILQVMEESEIHTWKLTSDSYLDYTAIPSLLPRNTAIGSDFKLIKPILTLDDRDIGIGGKWLANMLTLYKAELDGVVSMTTIAAYKVPFDLNIAAPIHEASGVTIGKDISLANQYMDIELDLKLQPAGYVAQVKRSFTYVDANGASHTAVMPNDYMYYPPSSRQELLEDTLQELNGRIVHYFDSHSDWHGQERMDFSTVLKMLGEKDGLVPGKIMDLEIQLALKPDNNKQAFTSQVDFSIPFSHEIAAPIHESSGMRIGKEIKLVNRPMHIHLDFKLEDAGFFGVLNRDFTYVAGGETRSLKLSPRRVYEAPISQNELLEEILAELTQGMETLFASNRSDLEVNFFNPQMPLGLLGTNEEGVLKGEFLGEEVDIEVGPNGLSDKLVAHLTYSIPFSTSIPAPIHEFSGVQIGKDIELPASEQHMMHISLDFVMENKGFVGTLNSNFDYADAEDRTQNLKMAERQIHESPADKQVLLADILKELNEGITSLFAQHRTQQEISFFAPHYPLALLGIKDNKVPGRFFGKTRRVSRFRSGCYWSSRE